MRSAGSCISVIFSREGGRIEGVGMGGCFGSGGLEMGRTIRYGGVGVRLFVCLCLCVFGEGGVVVLIYCIDSLIYSFIHFIVGILVGRVRH